MPKILKRAGIALLCILLVVILLAGGYVLYIVAQYSRIEDHTPLTVQNQQNQLLETGENYTALTFNIGFGAYDPPFSFFMDTGTMADGTPMKGKSGRAESLETVQKNTNGALGQILENTPDFCLLQEVDVKSHRSWKVNQAESIMQGLPEHGATFASNFHSAYLAYPLHQPHGAVQSGLLTLSKYQIEQAERRSYPVDGAFPTRFFDLDRCFSVHRLAVQGGGELVLVNNHMSAYDKGGTIRAQQMEMLTTFMQNEEEKGNWVIIGGDFNHALSGNVDEFPSQQQTPSWIFPFDESLLPPGFRIVLAQNKNEVATCRGSDIPYEKGVNYVVTVDGFIISDNIRAEAHNIDAGFLYSDHNPVFLEFILE